MHAIKVSFLLWFFFSSFLLLFSPCLVGLAKKKKDAGMRFVNEKQSQREHSTHQPHLISPFENVKTATGALQSKRKNGYNKEKKTNMECMINKKKIIHTANSRHYRLRGNQINKAGCMSTRALANEQSRASETNFMTKTGCDYSNFTNDNKVCVRI